MNFTKGKHVYSFTYLDGTTIQANRQNTRFVLKGKFIHEYYWDGKKFVEISMHPVNSIQSIEFCVPYIEHDKRVLWNKFVSSNPSLLNMKPWVIEPILKKVKDDFFKEEYDWNLIFYCQAPERLQRLADYLTGYLLSRGYDEY